MTAETAKDPKHQPIEQTPVFEIFEKVAAWAWIEVSSWNQFAKDTIGKQMVRALDSVNANLVEGDGRYSDLDALRHLVIARGSGREGRLWIDRAKNRSLIGSEKADMSLCEVDEGTRQLNLLINYRRRTANKNMVREELAHYSTIDPNIELSASPDGEVE